VLNTTTYILRKQFIPTELREILTDFLNLVDLLPCSVHTYLNSLKSEGNDIEEALLYQIAKENRLDYFTTEDKKDFKGFSLPALPVISAREFLKVES
jgi:hypothetical protein